MPIASYPGLLREEEKEDEAKVPIDVDSVVFML